ncbi:potassium channel family protein [Virgibacillus senegalensis]|uniref:potassium channel family protein n=1 Tax=Virgibacillus senegalensis TaxID=1499679 RepID=UPI000B14DBFC|nr:potassium channel family protein [Virgibacillus senegalensis]
MTWIIAGLIVWLLAGSLYSFISHKSYQRSYFSFEIFYTMIVLYLAVMLGFALLYFVLSFNGVVLIEGDSLSKVAPLEALAHALYFSGVTLMTVGYGDIIPVGIGRVLALTEALIGYILPAAFFLKVWQTSLEEKEQKENITSLKKHHPFQ